METVFSNIVINSQNMQNTHKKNIRILYKLYEKSDSKEFSDLCIRILHGTIRQDFENDNVKNILQFLGTFVAYVTNIESETQKDLASQLLFKTIIKDIFKMFKYNNETFKVNICYFVMTLLHNLGDIVIDDNLSLFIQNKLLENLQDPRPTVRLQAVKALSRLQDPSNQDCPVIKAYINSLRDVNTLVRREVVNCLAPNKQTIPKLCQATIDKDFHVRMVAYSHLSTTSIKHLKIVHRQAVLKHGFLENNVAAKRVFTSQLLPKWLAKLNGSYIDMIKAIKFDADEKDILTTQQLCGQLMDQFFKTEPIRDLIKAIPLNEDKLIPEHEITSELAHYWSIVVKYLRKSEDLENILESVLPELVIFCQYIDNLVSRKFSQIMEEWQSFQFQYLLYHLFEMAGDFDLSDTMGRHALDKLIKKVLQNHRLQPRLLNLLVSIASKLTLDSNLFATDICSIISDIWQPMIVVESRMQNPVERELEIAHMKLQLHTFAHELDQAIDQQNFRKAEELKHKVREQRRLIEEKENEETQSEQIKSTSNDSEMICWCLDLLGALLACGNIKTMCPALITCRQEFLEYHLKSTNMEIVWRAFKCVAIYSVFDKEIAKTYSEFISLPVMSYGNISDVNKSMLIDSIKTLVDLLRRFGLEFFGVEKEVNNGAQNTTVRRLYNNDSAEVDPLLNNSPLTVDGILNTCLDMIDDEDKEIRYTATEAMAKLILNNFPVNPMIITRLILKWYNPITQKKLQQMLGTIICEYSNKIQNAKETIAKAIIPILRNIADAPETSPVTMINIDGIIKFLVAITYSEEPTGLLHVHEFIARTVLHEISSRPSEAVTVYFIKLLMLLTVRSLQVAPTNSELVANSKLILEKEILDSVSQRRLLKFISKLSSSSTSSTLASTVNTISTQSNAPSRRPSETIEDDSNENYVANDKENDDLDPKRRKIDDDKPESEPNRPVLEQSSNKVNESVKSSSISESSIIPSSQPEPEPKLFRTRVTRASLRSMLLDNQVNKKVNDLENSSSNSSINSSESQTNRVGRKSKIRKTDNRVFPNGKNPSDVHNNIKALNRKQLMIRLTDVRYSPGSKISLQVKRKKSRGKKPRIEEGIHVSSQMNNSLTDELESDSPLNQSITKDRCIMVRGSRRLLVTESETSTDECNSPQSRKKKTKKKTF